VAAVILTLVFSLFSDIALYMVGIDGVPSIIGAVFQAPVVEESTKTVLLVVIVLAARRYFEGPPRRPRLRRPHRCRIRLYGEHPLPRRGLEREPVRRTDRDLHPAVPVRPAAAYGVLDLRRGDHRLRRTQMAVVVADPDVAARSRLRH